MAQKGRKKAVFVIDEVKLNVATAVAKGDRALSDILSEYKIPERTFYRWKKEPAFQLKISEIIADIDISMKSERIKIAKKELKRVLARLDLNEDKPMSRDVVALLRFIGDEVGDLEPKVKHTGEFGITIIDDIPRKVINSVMEQSKDSCNPDSQN
jgi:hypothetical protein